MLKNSFKNQPHCSPLVRSVPRVSRFKYFSISFSKGLCHFEDAPLRCFGLFLNLWEVYLGLLAERAGGERQRDGWKISDFLLKYVQRTQPEYKLGKQWSRKSSCRRGGDERERVGFRMMMAMGIMTMMMGKTLHD